MLDPHCYPTLYVLRPPTEEVDSLCTRCKVPCLMTALAPENQPSCGRKRSRSAIEEEPSTTSATSPQPPWKRAKRPFQSRQEAKAAYWDSLSKLCLTRRALKEFDRRNRRAAGPGATAPRSRPELDEVSGARKPPLVQIQRFARQGGPDLRDLRGYPEPVAVKSTARAMPSDQSTYRTQSKSASTLGESTAKTSHRKSSAYHPDFEQHLIDHGIHPNNRTQKPHNWDVIQHRMTQPRPSLSPSKFSDGAFETFQHANEEALTEAMVMRKPFPIISGDADIPSAGELPFGNLEPLTDGTLVDPKPDFYDGARPAELDRRIRAALGSYIIPSTQRQAPALPNFFAEGKGPNGSAAVAKRQACYDAAVGARGIHELRSFRMEDYETLYDNKTYTITSTYHDGTLKMYTTHLTQPTEPGNAPEYHMTQLRAFAMTDTPDAFRLGASAFRNARDWAKEQRDELIAAANGRVIGVAGETSTLESSSYSMLSQSTNEHAAIESETSADELAQDVKQSPSISHNRLKRGLEKPHSKLDPKKRPKKGSFGTDGRSDKRSRRTQVD